MKVIYDLFKVPMPLVAMDERHLSKQKRKLSRIIQINPKRQKYIVNSKKGDIVKYWHTPTKWTGLKIARSFTERVEV